MELIAKPTRFKIIWVKSYIFAANGGLTKDILKPKNLIADILGKLTGPKFEPNRTYWLNEVIDYDKLDNNLLENNDSNYALPTTSLTNPNQPVKCGWERPQKHASNVNITPDIFFFSYIILIYLIAPSQHNLSSHCWSMFWD